MPRVNKKHERIPTEDRRQRQRTLLIEERLAALEPSRSEAWQVKMIAAMLWLSEKDLQRPIEVGDRTLIIDGSLAYATGRDALADPVEDGFSLYDTVTGQRYRITVEPHAYNRQAVDLTALDRRFLAVQDAYRAQAQVERTRVSAEVDAELAQVAAPSV